MCSVCVKLRPVTRLRAWFPQGSEAMEDEKDYRQVAETVFPGGSHGNGSAMRVAPVGLLFGDDHDRVWSQARASALPTHVHPLGIEGAQLLALAVALASRRVTLDRDTFFEQLMSKCVTDEFRQKLAYAARATSVEEVAGLGNGIEAVDSVPTAIACFAQFPTSYEAAVANAVSGRGHGHNCCDDGCLVGSTHGSDRNSFSPAGDSGRFGKRAKLHFQTGGQPV